MCYTCYGISDGGSDRGRMNWSAVIPQINYGVRDLCYLPYEGHPKGCPRYGKKDTCPPRAPKIEDIIDLQKPVWAVWNVFNLEEHVRKMRSRLPHWSQRQLENCLYWQQGARNQLEKEIQLFIHWRYGITVLRCPEACGVNVTATMAVIGKFLEWPPVTKTYQVAIVGHRQVKRE